MKSNMEQALNEIEKDKIILFRNILDFTEEKYKTFESDYDYFIKQKTIELLKYLDLETVVHRLYKNMNIIDLYKIVEIFKKETEEME